MNHMKKKLSKGVAFHRGSIMVSRAVKNQMIAVQKFHDVNWSLVAEEAFVALIADVAAGKKVPTKYSSQVRREKKESK